MKSTYFHIVVGQFDAPIFNGLDGFFGQRFGADIPLVG